MTFVALLLMNVGILLLYAAYMNVSPFIILKSFLENKPIEQQ